jgi:HK97 family phage major capsid protein
MDPRRERLKAIAAKARAIAAKAEADGRDFTAAEQAEVKSLFDEAQKIATAIKARETDDATINELLGLSGDAGASFRMDGGKDLGGARSAMAKAWAGAIHNAATDRGAKAITSGTVTVPVVAGGISVPEDGPRTLLGIIPVEELEGSDQFSYLKNTVRTHAARSTAVGAVKPESDYTVALVTDRVRTFAHLSPEIPVQLLSDVDALASFIESTMIAGLDIAVEDAVVAGDEDTPSPVDDFDGILNAAGVGAQAWDTDALVSLRRAKGQLEALRLPGPFTAVLTSADWQALELLKDDERYTLADPGTAGRNTPVDSARMSVWGMRVVLSEGLDAGEAIVGQFTAEDIRLRVRETATIAVSEAMPDGEGVPGFARNMVTYRAEMRAGLELRRPSSFVVVDVSAGS